MTVQVSVRIAFKERPVYRSARSDNFAFVKACDLGALYRSASRIYYIAQRFIVIFSEQFKRNNAVLSAAYRNEITADFPFTAVFTLAVIIRYYLHKAVKISVYIISVEELSKSVEVELFPPQALLFVERTALYLYNRRTGAFPVADKLCHTEIEYYVFEKRSYVFEKSAFGFPRWIKMIIIYRKMKEYSVVGNVVAVIYKFLVHFTKLSVFSCVVHTVSSCLYYNRL